MSFELNKMMAALLVALLIGALSGVVAEQLIVIETPEKFGMNIKVVAIANETAEEKLPDVMELLKKADADAGKAMFSKCVQCHSLGAGGKHMVGPNLHNLLGQAKAAKPGYGYSKALQGKGGDWDAASLNEFLRKPRDYAPGTKMSFAGIKDHQARANLIAFLQTQK